MGLLGGGGKRSANRSHSTKPETNREGINNDEAPPSPDADPPAATGPPRPTMADDPLKGLSEYLKRREQMRQSAEKRREN
jgi:hypothetical protein